MRRLILNLALTAMLAGCASEPKMKHPESHQFDFLLGAWTVEAERHNPDGSTLRYAGKWTARTLDDGRIVLDEFQARGAAGEWLSTFVTLRTYAPATRRWEMTGLASLQPAAPARWHGEWREGEMHMDAEGLDSQGRTVHTHIRFFDIAADRFSWESQASFDGGSHWFLAARLTATRSAR
jgi:hypothetical protein